MLKGMDECKEYANWVCFIERRGLTDCEEEIRDPSGKRRAH